ncbi:MAG: hypothetical protein AB4426_12740 [Xenococcaceae cyanobacterium]
MTGKVLDSGAPGALALILPIALAIVVLFTAWPLLLLLIVLVLGWKIWRNYQWKQWCKQVNPFFHQLIKDNQGCLTPIDLSLKANLTGRAAKRFLDKKAEEFGIHPKVYEDKGTVYYFLTPSVLGSIFEDSELPSEQNIEGLAPEKPRQSARSSSEVEEHSHESSASEIAQLVELEDSQPLPKLERETIAQEEPQQLENTSSEVKDELEEPRESTNLSLIQAELAKRLELNSSTVGRRKSDPDFPQWSQSKDPEGIAWKYLSETKMFVPVSNPPLTSGTSGS